MFKRQKQQGCKSKCLQHESINHMTAQNLMLKHSKPISVIYVYNTKSLHYAATSSYPGDRSFVPKN